MKLSIEKTWDGEPLDSTERVDLELQVQDDLLLIEVSAPFHGDAVPEAPIGPMDGLWNYEVVELFIVGEDGAYTEIELSPHGHYLVLQLSGPRMVTKSLIPIAFQAQIQEERWVGRASVPIPVLPVKPAYLNAFAIHGDLERRYLCWTALPGVAPDFHQPERFEKHRIEGL